MGGGGRGGGREKNKKKKKRLPGAPHRAGMQMSASSIKIAPAVTFYYNRIIGPGLLRTGTGEGERRKRRGGKGSGIIYSKYLNSESVKGYVPPFQYMCLPETARMLDAPQPPSALNSLLPPCATPAKHIQGLPAPLDFPPSLPDWYQSTAGTPTATILRGVHAADPTAHLPPRAGKHGVCEALTLPPNLCSISQPLLVFLARLRVSHETEGAGGGGHMSLEVAPVLVTRGWPGDITRTWHRF